MRGEEKEGERCGIQWLTSVGPIHTLAAWDAGMCYISLKHLPVFIISMVSAYILKMCIIWVASQSCPSAKHWTRIQDWGLPVGTPTSDMTGILCLSSSFLPPVTDKCQKSQFTRKAMWSPQIKRAMPTQLRTVTRLLAKQGGRWVWEREFKRDRKREIREWGFWKYERHKDWSRKEPWPTNPQHATHWKN